MLVVEAALSQNPKLGYHQQDQTKDISKAEIEPRPVEDGG